MTAILLIAATAVAAPVIFRVSGPTAAGERVLLSGGNWGTDPRVQIGDRTVSPDLVSESELVFRLPCDGAATGTVVSKGGASAPFGVNFPESWWMFGDAFDRSTPGGRLRIFGRALAGAEGRLVDVAGRPQPLERTGADEWNVTFAVPASVANGTYVVELCTPRTKGWCRVGGWEVRPPRFVRKPEVFAVTDYGAVANDHRDDTAAIEGALAAASANGGGTVLLPRGRFKMLKTLAVPPNVLVKGASQLRTGIYWPDTMTPPEDLVSLCSGAGLSDLMLSSGQWRNGISGRTARGELGNVEDVLLENLTLRFVSDQQRDPCRRGGATNFLARYTMPGTAVRFVGSRRVRLRNVDVYSDKDAAGSQHFNIGGEWIEVTGSKFRGTGYSVLDGGPVVFEGNEGLGTTFSLRHYVNRLYFGGNETRLKYAGDREAVTLDGGRNAFKSRGAKKKGLRATAWYLAHGSVEGTHVTLEPPPEEELDPRYAEKPAAWVGRHLHILAGRGAGQFRRIVAAKGWRRFEIESPFDVQPDDTSLYELIFERNRILIVGNTMEDVGMVQLYGGATEVVVAENVAMRAGGFEGYGLIGRLPCWSVEFLGNRIVDGNNVRGPHDQAEPNDAVIGSHVLSGPCEVPMNRAFLIRGNVIEANGRIDLGGVHGAVVEGNSVADSDVGIVGGIYPRTCWIGANDFTGVNRVYKDLDAAVFGKESRDVSGIEKER